MELHQLTEHCYYSDPVHEGDRPALGLIAGASATLAVDTGNGPEHARWLLDQADKLGLPPVRWAVLTHWHWDHVMGGRAMQEAGASLLCTRGTQRQLSALSGCEWTDEAIARRVASGLEIPFCQEGILAEYPHEPRPLDPPLPDLVLEGPAAINLEGVTVRLLPQVSDHSPDGLLVHCLTDKVVYLGDSTSMNMYISPWHYTRERFLPFLDVLSGLEAAYYLHAHIPQPMTGEEFQRFCHDQRRYCRLVGEDVSLEGPAARFAAQLGREPTDEEREELNAFVMGNIVKGRV